MERPDTDALQLVGLTLEETVTLVRQRLGVLRLPEAVGRLVHERTNGNPLFGEELAYVLRDTGRVIVDGEDCRLAVSPEEFQQSALPDTVEGVVTSRVDRFDDNTQLVLKVASVVGRSFPIELVRDVFPVAEARDTVVSLIEPLLQADILRPVEDRPGFYLFKHVLTQEGVYRLMLFSQRRELHKAVADWIEAHSSPGELAPRYPLLAHHCEKAEEWERAVGYLERAGAHALATDANAESVAFYLSAQKLARLHHIAVEEERAGRWERDLAEGQFRRGNLSGTQDHGRNALTALGFPVPTSAVGTFGSLLWQVGKRMMQRWFPKGFADTSEGGRDRRLMATRVQNRLTEVAIYREDALGCLDSGLRELNTSEPAGQSAELGRAYAVLAIVLGTIPLHSICRAWCRRALDAAEAAGNPTALAYVLSRVGVYDLYIARWEMGDERLRRAAEIARALGDRRLREESMAIHGKHLFYRGRFPQALRIWEEVGTSALYSGGEQVHAWSLFGRAGNLLRMGSAADALPLLEQSCAWTTAKGTLSEEVWCYGLLALAYLRLGQTDKARSLAIKMLPKAASRPVAYWTQQSTAAIAEVLLTLWEDGEHDLARVAKKAARGCKTFASVFSFGQAQSHLWRGLAFQVDGQTDKARASWDECIATSERLGTPYERGRAYYEIARHLPAEHASRRRYLDESIAVLEPLQANYILQKARALLES